MTSENLKIADSELNAILNKAYAEIGKLNGLLILMPNKELLLSPLLVIESVKSSNIESINSTLLEQLQISAKGRQPFTVEQKQTENYRLAVIKGLEHLQKTGKFELGLVELIQRTLEPELSGIRNNQKVVIANNSTGQVLWEPPMGKDLILKYLKNWIEIINSDDQNDDLIKVAILHSQFEAIHPFVDGNGRTGRILIILFLVFKRYIPYPCIYLSEYILKTRTYYYIYLQESQNKQQHLGICKYIAHGILEKSRHSSNLIISISQLKNDAKVRFKKTLPKIYSDKMLEYLYQTPFYSISSISIDLYISRNTASKYLKLLVENNFIELYEDKKNKLYFNSALLKLLS